MKLALSFSAICKSLFFNHFRRKRIKYCPLQEIGLFSALFSVSFTGFSRFTGFRTGGGVGK